MPTYTYKCLKCSEETNVFHSMTETPRVKCPLCGSTRMKRLLGTGAGIIFKGSGFYETDYKRDGKKAGEPAKTESKSEGKTEAKSEPSPKGESKAKSSSSDAA